MYIHVIYLLYILCSYIHSCITAFSKTIELLIRIIGKDKYTTGTELIHEGLQSHILNKQVSIILLCW